MRPAWTAWLIVVLIRLLGGGPVWGESPGTPDSPIPGLSEPGVRDRYLVRQWTTQHGLPQNTVTCLEQTADGYLWLGTRYGLVRSDGMKLAVFLAELDDVATEAVDIRQLVADPEGALWILTRRGLFAHRSSRFTRVSPRLAGSTNSLSPSCLARARGGGLWLGGPEGVARLVNGEARMMLDRSRGFAADSVAELFEDRQGRLWVQVVRGLNRVWNRWDPATGRSEGLGEVMGKAWPEPDVRRPYQWECVHESPDGRLWVATPRELICVEGGREALRRPAGAWAGRSVRRLCDDGDGNLWIVTEGAASLHRFDGRELLAVQQLGTMTLEPDLRATLLDREGNLWLGSGNAGVYRVQARPLLTRRPVPDLSRMEVFSIVPRAAGGAWLGTLRGLIRNGPDGPQFIHGPGGEPEFRCKPVLEDRQAGVWIGEMGAGLARFDGQHWKRFDFRTLQGTANLKVRCLFEDANGGIWAGTEEGLLHSSERGMDWVRGTNGPPTNAVLAIAQTPDGALWFGTDGGGLHCRRAGQWRAIRKPDGLLHDRVWPLATEADGTLWLGTPLGLNRIRGDRIAAVTPRDGLSEDLAYSLLDDGRGWYWSHGNHGLSRLRRDQLNAVADGREPHVFCVTYDESDGMESTEGNGDEQPSAARLANGELWFPTTRGAVIVDPARLQDPVMPPLTVVEKLVAGGRELLGREHPPVTAAVDPAAKPVRLRVGPEQRNLIEFHYTSPSFRDAERMRFRYRLVGLEQTWNEPGTRRVAYYTGLRPGAYRFEVVAGNRFGHWSERPAAVELVVEPRFRETWTFRAMAAAAAAAGLVALRHRRVQYRRKIEELNRHQALDAERGRIARDLHDELGAGLAAMSMKVEFAHGLVRGGGDAGPILNQVSEAARDLVTRLREAVWALTPGCDTLESFASFVGAWVEDFVGNAQIACRIDVPAELPRRTMSAQLRHELVLAVKEAVTNAVRHSGASEIRLSLRADRGELTIQVQDNGTGFEAPPLERVLAGARGGSGLANLRQRLTTIGGQCDLESASGRGTLISLRLPLSKLLS